VGRDATTTITASISSLESTRPAFFAPSKRATRSWTASTNARSSNTWALAISACNLRWSASIASGSLGSRASRSAVLESSSARPGSASMKRFRAE
jgi:hypothetical protein